MKFYLNKLLILLIGISFFLKCSTEKNTIVHRSYHNLNARYNGFFNARMSMQKGMESLHNKHEENFDKILPVFIIGNNKESKTIYPQMDRVIKKTSKVIDEHSMEIRGKERCKWIDDNYLLMGQAYFYKKEFERAKKIFKYIVKTYKTQEGNVLDKAMLWLIRTHKENGSLSKAKTVLKMVEDKGDFPEELNDKYNEVVASLMIELKKYGKAIDHLEKAISEKHKIWDSERRNRLMFILAQLYQKKENYKTADYYYAEVAGNNTSYEMTFYANKNRAANGKTNNPKELEETLKDMLKDEKNKEYYDQIHYALADLMFENNKPEKGIKHLKLSIRNNMGNKKQKLRSYLRLADIYYEDKNYRKGGAYYDSTLALINEGHKRYEEIKTKSESLGKLVKNLNIIKTQDSLRRMANMDKRKRDSIIEAHILNQREKREEKRENESSITNNSIERNNQDNFGNDYSGSVWYFYNQKAKASGFNSFRERFGNRELKDNWRRSKSTSGGYAGKQSSEKENSKEKQPIATKEEILSKLPTTKKEMKESKRKSVKAYYNAGHIYKEKLKNTNLAIESFKKITNNFSDSVSLAPSAYYQLYRAYKEREEKSSFLSMGDKGSSKYYKKTILEKYPDSKYAKMLSDSDFVSKEEKKLKKHKEAYTKTYNSFKRGYYTKTISKADSFLKKNPESSLLPKFILVQSLAIGKKGYINKTKKKLKKLKKQHSGTEEAKEAQFLLNKLNGIKEKQNIDEYKGDIYSSQENKKHFFIYIFPTGKESLAKVKRNFSDFNNEYFSTKNLNLTSTLLGKDDHMLIVKRFSDKKSAIDYYDTFKGNCVLTNEDEIKKAEFYAISIENFKTLIKDEKDTKEYKAFFKAQYLK